MHNDTDRMSRYGIIKAEARMVAAYADTAKSGPSTVAETRTASGSLRLGIVELLKFQPQTACRTLIDG
jgi:hypothetical protein